MNLVRNHILYYKSEMKELHDKYGINLPDEYFLQTPTEVAGEYMAREEEIRQKAVKTLDFYRKDENFLFLIENRINLTEKEIKNIS